MSERWESGTERSCLSFKAAEGALGSQERRALSLTLSCDFSLPSTDASQPSINVASDAIIFSLL